LAAPAQLARGTGRRKEAVCRVRLIEGTGTFKLNGRPLEDYFPNPAHRRLVTEPLRVTDTLERYDVLANLDGGGVSGQAGALRHAISRALVDLDVELRPELKKRGFLTRDAREVER
jgi:small subunit ribosomal protein S9